MKMSRSSRLANNIFKRAAIQVADVPTFLCPGLLQTLSLEAPQRFVERRRVFSQASYRQSTSIGHTAGLNVPANPVGVLEKLPLQCAGCGALSQTVDEEAPGFYTHTRKSVQLYLHGRSSPTLSAEDRIVIEALANAKSSATNFDVSDISTSRKYIEPPICDRCHRLKHHETGVSIHHPSIQSLQDTIFESPHKYNHVYHVLDAADFPMSLVPGLHRLLNITPQRSLNRRSKSGRFYHGKKTEVSFVITRSDLLAPLKTQVDSMMPYLRVVLRDALGRSGQDVRLGNIRCVSSKRSWWTLDLKEEIWSRGGGGWMVGKVNVGKSQLFHSVFPKGRRSREISVGQKPANSFGITQEEVVGRLVPDNNSSVTEENSAQTVEYTAIGDTSVHLSNGVSDHDKVRNETLEDDYYSSVSLDTSSLLPPVPPETDYPEMPLVSFLPGTTASPIRLSFGNGKGELIDLPGLSRGDLELYVRPKHRQQLVMRSRILPEQKVIRPGQSLLLGGFIRITPTTPDIVVLAYAFTPIHAHLTSTEKAIGTQTQTRESHVENISLPETGEKIASAGTFYLKWDATKAHTGPVTARETAGISVEKLPYRVLATDILIEGCGWVELVAQVSKSKSNLQSLKGKNGESDEWGHETRNDNEETDQNYPAVEVFTPDGRFIAVRRPMNAWLNIAKKPTKGKLQGRPRRSMKGIKKAEKKRARALE